MWTCVLELLFFQAEDGIRELVRSRGLGDVYKRQLVARIGVGRLLAISCGLTGAALVGYTLVPQWWMMVLLGIMAGLGAGAIDAGLNTYAAAHFRPGLVQWLHASYGVGVTIGPIIMTLALTTLDSWRVGYRVVAGFQVLMALAFALTLPWWTNQQERAADGPHEKRLTDYKTPLSETIRRPRVWLSVLLFFLYVGCLLYTSDAADERSSVDLGGRRYIKKKKKKTKK